MSRVHFHFEPFWPRFDDFEIALTAVWQPQSANSDPLARLDDMLRNLVHKLQRWSATKIGDIKSQLLMAHELVSRLDAAQDVRGLSEAEAGLRRRMKMRCLGLASLERTMARQRSRVRQLEESDANTAYFHLIARGRRRRNYIPVLNVAGHVMVDHDGMESALHEHFVSVFRTTEAGGTTLDFVALGIQAIDLCEQQAQFSADEVWTVIKKMPSDWAPGPDGFTGAFYKAAWHVIHPDIMAAIQAFSKGNCRSMGKLNSPLVTLLPKKFGASYLGDFRLITMIHSFAKLISKMLAMCLAQRMDEIVDKN